jgi:2-oxo-4-hydroxy-4-carboxy-5-ureidoimidazoline decarboxylase
MTELTLDALNRADREAFVAALGSIYEHSPWVADAVYGQQPFANLNVLHEAMKATVRAVADDRILALLNLHPDLAGKAAQAGTMAADSVSEQGSAGLDRLSKSEFDRFQALNAAYKEKFGFPFIVCVRRHTKDSIFRQFETRLRNDRAAEYKAALDEIFRITALRLDQHVTATERLAVYGFLDVHVIDIAAGQPATGMKVDLYELSASGAERKRASATIDAKGLPDRPFFPVQPIPIGQYELRFQCGDYFAGSETQPRFLDVVPVKFAVADAEGSYHIPLRVTPWTYSVYRGSP